MGLLKRNGKVEWVSKDSVHRMSPEEAIAFLLFADAEVERHKEDIVSIYDTINTIKQVHRLEKTDTEGYYAHTVDYSTAYDKLGGDHDD